MADIEKVIKGLHCRGQDLMIDLPACDQCDYQIQMVNRMGCDYRQICRDAIELLKEQETEWEHLWDAPDGTFKGRCKKCGFVHFFIEGHDTQYKFCPECGRSVK